MSIDWKSIVIFLHAQGKNATKIHREILETLPNKCPCYGTVTRILRFQQFPSESQQCHFFEKNEEMEEKAVLISEILKDYPFSSVRQIEEMTGIPRSTVYDILTKRLHYEVRKLRWVPHFLNSDQKKIE